jgi:D-cysteine desulfhydrase family pyridoxal phosphate-dependent enzyme
MNDPNELVERLSKFHRVELAHLPTPLDKLENLTETLERFDVFLKRDDMTGLAFGGNKARKLDFIIADALNQGADTLVTWGGVQSNWCRQVAAAAAQIGMKAVLVLFKSSASSSENDGNLLLDHMFAADVRIVEAGAIANMMELASVQRFLDPIVDEVKQGGDVPYLLPIGGSLVEGSMGQPWGSVAYVNAFAELAEQASADDVRIDSVILATGSGSTQAGLLVGAKVFSPATRIIGITVYSSKQKMTEYVESIAKATIKQLDSSVELLDEDIIVFEEYLRDGYGIFNEDVGSALSLMAESEGVLLDPVYTGKAMVGMLDLMNKDYFADGENIVLLHSGGTPALFPYRGQITSSLKQD